MRKIKLSVPVLLISTALSGCAGLGMATSPEVDAKIEKYGLDKDQICIDNQLLLNSAGQCNLFNVITDEHVDYSLSLREAEKQNEMKKKKREQEFEAICDKANGTVQEGTCITQLGYSKRFNINQQDELIEYINSDLKQKEVWKLEAEKYNTIKALCNSFRMSKYDAENRTCETHDKIMGMLLGEDEIKYQTMLPIVALKDLKAAEKEKIQNRIKWKKAAQNYTGTVEELCYSIRNEYHAYTYDAENFIPETLECDIPHKIAQDKFDSMMPIVLARQPELLKKQNDLKLAKEKKQQADIEKWQARKGHTYQLATGKNYTCEMQGLNISSRLLLGEKSAQMGSIPFDFIERYDSFDLYRGITSKGEVVTIQVLNNKAINGGNVNLIFNGIGYYCSN